MRPAPRQPCAAWVVTAALFLALALPTRARAAAPIPRGWDSARFISTAEIQPGMRGVGYTVFQGTKIEPFDVEVIGVMYNSSPKRDVIIARLSGGPLATTGVIQGMSGSPVFLDGRLAGAVAYGWSFTAEPICGIQPIQLMLPIADRPAGTPQDVAAASPTVAAPLELTGTQVATLPDFPVQGAVRLEPLATPIMMGGFAPGYVEQIKPWFAPFGLTPMAGGGAAGDYGDVNPALEPGAALAVPLLTGDASAAAVGTVTHTEGNMVMGFGHQFLYRGGVSLPLANAYVVGVLASQMVSTKLAVALHTVGWLQQDWLTGVAGTLGPGPPMVPVQVRVRGPDMETPDTYNYEVAPQREMLPMMLASSSGGAVYNVVPAGAPFSAMMDLTIHAVGHDPITTQLFYSGRTGVSGPVGRNLLAYARALLNNPYGRLALERVDVSVVVRDGLDIAYLEEVRPQYLTVRPGETLPVTIVYRHHEGERERASVALQIPATARDGMYTLVVSDAGRTQLLERRRAPMRYRPTTLEQYLALLDEDYPENEFTVTLLSPRPGMAVHGEELTHLPGSVLNVMRAGTRRDLVQPTRGTVVAEAALALGAVVRGAATVRIRVDRHAP